MAQTNLTDASKKEAVPQSSRIEMQRYQIFVGIQMFF